MDPRESHGVMMVASTMGSSTCVLHHTACEALDFGASCQNTMQKYHKNRGRLRYSDDQLFSSYPATLPSNPATLPMKTFLSKNE